MSNPLPRLVERIGAQAMAEIDEMRLDDKVKGIPGGVSNLRFGQIGHQGWNVLKEDLPLPVAVLKTSAVENNSRWMAQFLQATGAVIAPHGKTTMSPQLFHRQLADGAWAITVATIGQLQICRRFGLKRLLLANQLIGRQAIGYVVGELARDPDFEFYALADSIEGVCMIVAEAKRAGLDRPVNLLLEGGLQGCRTGCRTREAALAVARIIRGQAPWVALRGVEGFEGLVHGASTDECEAAVRDFLDFLIEIAADCRKENLFSDGQIILSAGGSAYYDLAAERLAAAGIADALVVVRSGCYLTQDSALYRTAFERIRARSPVAAKLAGGLKSALELWAYVQSRPEPGRMILNLGRRDVSFDVDLPVLLSWFRPGGTAGPQSLIPGHKIVELNDQHAHVVVPVESPLQVGDLVALGVSHPCTTFDKWEILFFVNDTYDVTGAVRTFF
jgi:D-serine dehydratase